MRRRSARRGPGPRGGGCSRPAHPGQARCGTAARRRGLRRGNPRLARTRSCSAHARLSVAGPEHRGAILRASSRSAHARPVRGATLGPVRAVLGRGRGPRAGPARATAAAAGQRPPAGARDARPGRPGRALRAGSHGRLPAKEPRLQRVGRDGRRGLDRDGCGRRAAGTSPPRPIASSRATIRCRSTRCARCRRASVTAIDSAVTRASVPTPGGRGIDAHARVRARRRARRDPDRRSRARPRRAARSAASRRAEVADELHVRGIADHEHELVALLGDAGRVEGVAGLEHLEERRGAVREHDPADRGAVVEAEAVRLEASSRARRPGPACRRARRGRAGRRRPASRRRRASRRAAAALLPGRRASRPRVPGDGCAGRRAAPSAMSRGCRGTIANRRSVAVGYGRFTMPVTVALRPSVRGGARDPAPREPGEGDARRPGRHELRGPAVAAALDVRDRPGDPHEPPLDRRGRRPAEGRRARGWRIRAPARRRP